MTLKFFVAASILAAAPFAAFAQQDNSNAQPWMPTIEDAQKLVETISSDKDKLKAYCEIGKLHEQIERAEEENDTKDFEALVAQLDGLEQQNGARLHKGGGRLGGSRSKLCRRAEVQRRI
jgi:hypothetical protein